MALSFGRSKGEDVVSLIAAKKYARAIELLKAQLQRRGANPSLRMQLADVLILAEKKQEAVALLLPLADQYAREGFAAKAVSVLKKIQKVDPGRRDVEERLARQIEEKQREAVVLAPVRSDVPFGIEEVGSPAHDDAGPALEIGLDSIAPISAPVDHVPGPSEPVPSRPVASEPPRAEPHELRTPAPAAEGGPTTDDVIEDYDLLYAADEEGEDEEEIEVPVEVVPESADAEPMSAGQFADELMGLVDTVFQEFPGPSSTPTEAAPPRQAGPRRTGSQIVVSPLFRDFSVDEMVAVIQGLKLLTYDRGQVILREGQPGGSLYALASGRARAFRKDPATGRQNPIGDLKEGAFFGEMSILTGQPRAASVVALTRCELLELDRPALDGITRSHPHVWDVLREFAEKRAASARR